MSRKQVGAIDSELLAAVDERAEFLGQTRRVFIERALHERIATADLVFDPNTTALVQSGPHVHYVRQPGPNGENVRPSDQAKRNVKPIPKKGQS